MKTVIMQSVLFENFVKQNPMISITGGTQCEINKDGNLQLFLFYNNPRQVEIDAFKNQTPSLYYYELKDMSALILAFCGWTEIIINPSYYTDDRFEKLLTKPELLLHCTLVDPKTKTALMSKTFTISNKQREFANKGLQLNAKHDEREFTYWISNVLYSRKTRENIKLSKYIGKLYENLDTEIIVRLY